MRGRDYVPEREALAVEIELAHGEIRKGKLWVPVGKLLADALNGTQAFVEFTPFGEERTALLAKAQIVVIRSIEIPKLVPLHERRGVAGGDDPHHILGVALGAPWATVRESYIRLTKTYHPDRYSGADLPSEVVEYLGAKARRINAAYELLEDSLKRVASSRTVEANCAGN